MKGGKCHFRKPSPNIGPSLRRAKRDTFRPQDRMSLSLSSRVADHWSSPFETLQTHRGDCEDYAIVKYVALLEAGVSRDDLKIVILRKFLPNETHAVLAARVDGEWLILDNDRLALVRDSDLARAQPEVLLDQHGAHRIISSD
jgi:hypothetical protein